MKLELQQLLDLGLDEQLEKKLNKLFSKVGKVRKPSSIEELENCKTVFLTKKEFSQLQIFTNKDQQENDWILSEYSAKNIPQFHLYKTEKDLYLIDTQGFSYPRYWLKVTVKNGN